MKNIWNRIKNMRQSTLSLIVSLFFLSVAGVWGWQFMDGFKKVLSFGLFAGFSAVFLFFFSAYLHFLKKEKNYMINRKITKARFLYLYIIFGSILALGYLVLSFIIDTPKHWALTPLYILVMFTATRFLVKNWKMIWLYVTDMQQGKLLLYLNDYTHFSEEHKMKLIKWVYLNPRRVRQETHTKISEKLMKKEELTKEEQRKLKFRSVYCPQQLKDHFNEAILVHVLIHAHRNIQILDDDLREIMNLTDENMLAFDLSREMDKATSKKYQKMIETGKKAAERLNK